MRDALEIERRNDSLGNVADSMDWHGDNFKYGMHVGKLLALEWMLGNVSTGEMCIHHDYEDYLRAGKELREDLKEELKQEGEEDQTE
jgi:hypothetical protein